MIGISMDAILLFKIINMNENLDLLTTEALIKRRNLSSFALILVALGASIAIIASFYSLSQNGIFPTNTFLASIIGLMAAIPVFLERQKIIELLDAGIIK